MGIAIAEAASEYGAEVELVLGPVEKKPEDSRIEVINVSTAVSMAKECISRFPRCDCAILAAAVADFYPVSFSENKMKRKDDEIILKLKPTTDIAQALGKLKRNTQILAGFALETENEIENATAKMRRKNLDLIILNSLRDEGAGFGYNTNRITIIDSNNIIDKFELKSKEEVARDILDKIVSMVNKQSK
jgi:phosphopantothenoylcysteine decarboxylase/phosphopantothenate--cysteine ligase